MATTDTGTLVAPELVITRVFNAPRELVFRAWTDPDHIRKWFGPKDHPATRMAMDVRPGGRWRGCLRSTETGNDLWLGGVYREIAPPERLVFTFAEQGAKTLMTFRQTPFRSTGELDGHRGGWTSSFDRLGDHLEG